MGIMYVSAALERRDIQMDPTAKLLLVAIGEHINSETGYGWPSLQRLADLVGIHKSNATRWMQWLEENQLITVERAPNKPNRYRMDWVTGGALAQPGGSASATRTRKNQKETRRVAPDATPTPPPLAEVLAAQEQYR